MNNRQDRFDVIKHVIGTNTVANQMQLQEILSGMGVEVTQATLSRDLNTLGVVKIKKDGNFCYMIPEVHSEPILQTSKSIQGIESLRFCGNLAVIKTHPGFASVIASIIDKNCGMPIVGTIAGDDTVFVAFDSEPEELIHTLSGVIPTIGNKVKSK